MSTENPSLPKGTCKNCGQLIYWLRVSSKKNKMQVSHITDNEYMAHSMVCPTVLAYEERMRRNEISKTSKNKKNVDIKKNNS